MKILKSKKLWMQVSAIVLVGIVSVIAKQLDIGDEQTQTIIEYVFKLAGLSIAAHTASDLTSMIKGLQKTDK